MNKCSWQPADGDKNFVDDSFLTDDDDVATGTVVDEPKNSKTVLSPVHQNTIATTAAATEILLKL